MILFQSTSDPWPVRAPGSWASSGFCRTGCGACAQGLLRIEVQTGREPVTLAQWGFLHSWIPGDPVTPGVWAVVVASSPLMLSVLEHLGIV